MATNVSDRENLQNELKKKQICRFCLSQTKLSNIFARDGQASLAPLPVQVMSCASIEVFTNDGMPAWICNECRALFEHSYRFKQMCKRADTLLRQFPLTGEWPRPLEKPRIPLYEAKRTQSTATYPVTGSPSNAQPVLQNLYTQSKKILNSNPVATPEPPAPIRPTLKKEPLSEELNNLFNKVDCSDLSMEEVQRLIANVGDEEEPQQQQQQQHHQHITIKRAPKLLNKSSMRILNKEANVVVEPKLSVPKVKLDDDGNVIVTAVIDPPVKYDNQSDPVKDAKPVATNVYPCPHCDRSFPLLQLRDIHMVNHTRERRFPCANCEKSFFSKYDLQKHEVRHTGEKPFKCVVCGKGFSRATLLHRHEKVHTEIPKYLCVHCEKAFLSKEEMEQHTARHEKNRPFKCQVCQKTFAFKQGLERHEAIHSSVQPYPCQYCEQSFPTPSKLARHLTAHAGKRPYPCKYCSKSYVLSHHLSRHLRSHKQVKGSHVCSECNKVFKTRDELIYHTAVHSTVSLVCTLCQQQLGSAEAVTAHLKEHIDGDAFACEFCDLIFLRANALTAHSEERHAKEMAVYNEDMKSAAQKTTTTPNADTTTLQHSNVQNSNNDEHQDVHYMRDEYDEEDDDDYDDGDDDDDDEEISEQIVETTIAQEKPKILNQIVINSPKDVKYLLMPKDDKNEPSNKNIAKVEQQQQQQPQPVVRKRKIISVDGHLKEVEYTPTENVDEKRKIVILDDTKVKIKIEKDEKNASTQRKPTTTLQETNAAIKRRSNEMKSANNNKTEQTQTKKNSPKVHITASNSPTTSKSSETIAKRETSPRVKQIRLSKAQAETLTKQGRIQFKDGNMILTKEPPATPTRSSKRAKHV